MRIPAHTLLFTILCCVFIASCSKSKQHNLTYCPSEKAVTDAVKENLDFVTVEIGRWKIIKLNNSKQFGFQRASYTSGWPACLYGQQGKDPSIELSPRVQPELFPAWSGTKGGTKQWSAPDCHGKTNDCPWQAVPWDAEKNQAM